MAPRKQVRSSKTKTTKRSKPTKAARTARKTRVAKPTGKRSEGLTPRQKRNFETGVAGQYQPRHRPPAHDQRQDSRGASIQSDAAAQSSKCRPTAPASSAGRIPSEKFCLQIVSNRLIDPVVRSPQSLYNSFNVPLHSCSDCFRRVPSASANSRSNRSNTFTPSSTSTVPT